MVTKQQAINAHHGQEFHYTGPSSRNPHGVTCQRTEGPRGGITETVVRARVTGTCQTWKREPERFRLPVKHGMYESAAITNYNADDWHASSDCPLIVHAMDCQTVQA